MKDTEKMITEINEITEANYKREHIFMWEFVINRIKDASLLISDKKDVNLYEVKREYLEKVKARLEEKEFLSEKDKWLLNKINDGMRNYCLACQYVLDKSYYEGCFTDCPLLENNRGKLEHTCSYFTSYYNLLVIALQGHDYETALKIAIRIKDAWREVE